jgi:hypothetical protein
MIERRPMAGTAGLHHERTGDVVGRLAALGFTVPLADGQGALASEMSLAVSFDALLCNGRYALALQRRLGRLAGAGARVCLLLAQSGDHDTTPAQWREFHARLRQAMPPAAGSPVFCLPCHHSSLANAEDLLSGTCYVLCDSLQMRSHRDPRAQQAIDTNWRTLWRYRHGQDRLLPAYGSFVRSACPLLGDEAATVVLPATGLCVPAGSAWLSLGVDLAVFADATGRLDLPDLQAAIDEAVHIADELLDRGMHAGAAERRDAAENRRLALTINGIGDLVLKRGENPASLDCLRALDTDLQAIRDAVDRASARESRRAGPLPALSLPCRDWFDGQHGARWRQHYEAARRHIAVRHRNLLAISPYAVLPSASPCHSGFSDLLPLLAFADAWAFVGAPNFERWNLSQFKHFHMRARAIIQASQVTTRIAAGA